MKLSLCTLVLLAGTVIPVAQAFSLYDTAPSIGLAQNANLTYSASLTFGYDSNVNGSSQQGDGSLYTRFGLGASQSENDAMTRLSWSARVGGTLYNKNADGTDDKTFADISLALSMNHTIDNKSSNNLNLRFTITPELDYSNGISGANREGDSMNWSISDSYTRKIDTKKSISVNAGYSGNVYLSEIYDIDDREYLSVSSSLRYKESNLVSYSLNASGQFDFRRFGFDSQNIYLTGGTQRTLSDVSSMGVTLGAQVKFIESTCKVYPNLKASYRRTVAKGLSFSAYVALDNENVDTYRYASGGNYLSDMTWRIGGNLSKQLNTRMTLTGGYSIIIAQYSDNDLGADDSDEITYNLNLGLRYRINTQTSFSVNYSYTVANEDAGDYARNTISGSLSYTF